MHATNKYKYKSNTAEIQIIADHIGIVFFDAVTARNVRYFYFPGKCKTRGVNILKNMNEAEMVVVVRAFEFTFCVFRTGL